MTTLCDVIDNCTDCPRCGDDCDGERLYTHEEAWGMTDLISRADAIEARTEYRNEDMLDSEKATYNKGWNDCNDAWIAILKALPSADAIQGWIPCSERLPDWKDMVEGVIITTENGRVTFADYCTENGMFHDVGQDVWASDMLAWMPLPKPYREDGE